MAISSAADRVLSPAPSLKLCFAHVAYNFTAAFGASGLVMTPGFVRNAEELEPYLAEVEVLVISGLWDNSYLERAPRLRYVQSVSSGTNQYDAEAFKRHGVLLSSARGVNQNAVSEHAMGLILSLTRRLHEARDNQLRGVWGSAGKELCSREDELPGKTMLVVGAGAIGERINRLGKAFDMKVIGVRRDPDRGLGGADEMHSFTDISALLPRADIVVLCCPLTDETRHIMNPVTFALMKPDAYLINVARGGCVDTDALVSALDGGKLAGAGIDVTEEEPLPAGSPLWARRDVMLTSHCGGETRKYEINVVDLLRRNLDILWSGSEDLINRVA